MMSVALILSLFVTSKGVTALGGEMPSTKNPPPLIFSMKAEPKSLDPTTMPGGESAYLFSNVYRGLTRFVSGQELIFDQAERCHYKSQTTFACTLRKEARWSDGSPVTAQDFVNQFKRLIAPSSQCPVVNLLFGIKNARAIYDGQVKSIDQLGVAAKSASEIEFELTERDNEFLEKLSNPLLVPYRAPAPGSSNNHDDKATWLYNGPYFVKSWVKNQRIKLESNLFYQGANKTRPPVEIVFAAEDSAALTLYEKGVINFLTRLTTINIPKYKDRPDFHRVAQSRFDYIGFNQRPGQFFENKENRKLFAQSANYEDFKKAFFALGAPGCPSLGEPFLSEDGSHCQKFAGGQNAAALNLSAAARPLLKAVKEKPLKFGFSKLGGDDIRRQAEWFQGQWMQNIGIRVELKDSEQKQYLELLKHNPPDLFRKGIMLNRPTCLAALENFKKGHPENYSGFYNLRFENLTDALLKQKMSAGERASVCGVASDILFKEEYVGIPLGRMDFILLVNPQFQGWQLNELNQLDLTHLKYVEKK